MEEAIKILGIISERNYLELSEQIKDLRAEGYLVLYNNANNHSELHVTKKGSTFYIYEDYEYKGCFLTEEELENFKEEIAWQN